MGLKWDWERGRVTRGKGEKKRDDESNCPVRPRSDCNVVPASHPSLSFLSFPADPVPVFSFLSSSRGKKKESAFSVAGAKKGFCLPVVVVCCDRPASCYTPKNNSPPPSFSPFLHILLRSLAYYLLLLFLFLLFWCFLCHCRAHFRPFSSLNERPDKRKAPTTASPKIFFVFRIQKFTKENFLQGRL